MSTNAEHVTRMDSHFNRWDADFDALVAEGEKVGAEARLMYHERARDLRATREAAQKRFQEFCFAGEWAGAHLRAGLEGAWEEMEGVLKKVSSELKQ